MSDAAFEISGSSTSTPSTKVMAKLKLAQASMSNLCSICNKRVYDMEKIAIDQQVIFHKSCFRCSQCKGILSVRNYTMAEGELFCKQHYLRQFKEVGGKYNFSGSPATPSRTAEVRTEALSSPSVRSPTSATRNDSGLVDTPRPAKSWQLTSSASIETPRDGPPAMVEIVRSPTGLGPTGAGVASIRSMFENPSGGNKTDSRKVTSPTKVTSPSVQDDEVSVISRMKSQSAVQSRRAQFSGATVDQENNGTENVHIGSSSASNGLHVYDDVNLPKPATRTAAPQPQRNEEEEEEEEEEEVEYETRSHHDLELEQHDVYMGPCDYPDEEYENGGGNVEVDGDGDYPGQEEYNNDDQIQDDCNERDGNGNDDTYLHEKNDHLAPEQDEEAESADYQHDYEQHRDQEFNDGDGNPDDEYVDAD